MQENIVLELKNIISSYEGESLSKKLSQYHDRDIASVFKDLSDTERKKIYNTLSTQELSDFFAYLDDPKLYLSELDNEETADIIESMDSDDAIDILEKLDEDEREDIMRLMDKESFEDVKLLFSYDEDTIGSLMTTNFITLHKGDSIRFAMRHLIKEAAHNDNILTIYVLDEKNKYYGSIDLKDLILARENQDINEIIKTHYPVLNASDNISENITDIIEYDLEILPVVDESNNLIGVITNDDIVEAYDKEMQEDYAKFAALSSESSIQEKAFASVKKRLPWLIALLVIALLISLLTSQFEIVILTIPIIIFFQPLILDMAGNAGTQSLAVTIRGITNKDPIKVHRLVWKEFMVGLINGSILGITVFAVVFLYLLIIKNPIVVGHEFSYVLALKASGVVSLSLFLAISVSSFVGSAIPLFLNKIKIDPAVASGPLITTLNDLTALISFYLLAILLFDAFM
ncbi:MAG: magnesium transporter [Candidatus Neomarinimicrobiota bacterium]|jgi:magnesium transporter